MQSFLEEDVPHLYFDHHTFGKLCNGTIKAIWEAIPDMMDQIILPVYETRGNDKMAWMLLYQEWDMIRLQKQEAQPNRPATKILRKCGAIVPEFIKDQGSVCFEQAGNIWR
jgi:hypothetical protein